MVLFLRIWAAVTVVNLIVLSVFVGLATVQFANINATLVKERLGVLANRTVAPFAAAVRLGLPLSSVRNATALLERARQTDDEIAALHVFDAAGRVVHSTASSPPATIPAAAARARRTDAAPWFGETDDGFIGGIGIAGPDGASAGGILILYPVAAHRTQVSAMTAELVLAAIAAVLVAGAGGTVLLWAGLARTLTRFAAIDGIYRSFEQSGWRRAAGRADDAVDGADAPGSSALREGLEAAAACYRETGRRLQRAAGAPDA